jgi:thiol-disulfide isomerase/thioredoxin
MKSRWSKITKNHPLLRIVDYEYDDQPELVNQYQIGNILPVVIFVTDDGTEVHRLIGEKSVRELEKTLEELHA